MYIGLLVPATPAQTKCSAQVGTANWEKLREYEATFLWFNQITISEFSSVVESILDKYSESKYPDLSLTWRSTSEDRPYRKVDFNGYFLPDPEDNKHLDRDLLTLANGLPNREFEFNASQIEDGYQFRFEARSIPYDDPLVRFLYSYALDSSRCQNFSLPQEILKNTRLTVEKHNLVISTHLTRNELAKLRREGSLRN